MKLGKLFSVVSTVVVGGALMLMTAGGAQASPETLYGSPIAPQSLKPTLAPQELTSARINTNLVKSLGTAKITTLQLAKPAVSGKYVPEFDAKSSGAAIALLLGGVAVLVERRRRKAGSAVAV